MTEAEWLGCSNPQPMLEYLGSKVSDRKVRLFAVACCRRVWSSLEHEEFRDAVLKAESFADGLVDEAEMLQAHEKARPIFVTLHDGRDNGPGAALTASAFPSSPKSIWDRIADALDDPWWEDEMDKGDRLAPALVTARQAARAAAYLRGEHVLESPATIAEHQEQTALVHCLFGNPFHPQSVGAAWLTQEVKSLAEAIYAGRAFDRMPHLADALEATGCTNPDLIQHCRSSREHARGCWVLDLLLGKEGEAPATGRP